MQSSVKGIVHNVELQNLMSCWTGWRMWDQNILFREAGFEEWRFRL